MEKAIEIRDLSVAYDRRPVVEGVTLSIPSEAMVGIVGPNGGGKSTLLKALLGLVPRKRGEVEVLGRPVDRRVLRLVGYVPQREDVDWNFPVSAFDVVMMGRVPSMKLFRRPTARDKELVWEALRTVGMEKYADTRIGSSQAGSSSGSFWRELWPRRPRCCCWTSPSPG